MEKDIYFMKQALKEAKKAEKIGEIPIGAIIVKDDKIIARGYNVREKKGIAIAHAEMIAIEKACKKLKSWRLLGCTMYVTLEPCPMCLGAAVNARLDSVIYGAKDEKSGACGGKINLCEHEFLNHKIKTYGGVLEQDCKKFIIDFFKSLRGK